MSLDLVLVSVHSPHDTLRWLYLQRVTEACAADTGAEYHPRLSGLGYEAGSDSEAAGPISALRPQHADATSSHSAHPTGGQGTHSLLDPSGGATDSLSAATLAAGTGASAGAGARQHPQPNGHGADFTASQGERSLLDPSAGASDTPSASTLAAGNGADAGDVPRPESPARESIAEASHAVSLLLSVWLLGQDHSACMLAGHGEQLVSGAAAPRVAHIQNVHSRKSNLHLERNQSPGKSSILATPLSLSGVRLP